MALTVLRNKYAEDLEELLQCPVCFELMKGPVPVCALGHHMCIVCQPKLAHCPICRTPFKGARNFLVETLMLKFDEIKISLINPNHSLNEKVIKNVVCVQTQTDKSLIEENATATEVSLPNGKKSIITKNPKISKTAPVVGKGLYPCRLGNCIEELPHGRMLNHIRYYHKIDLIEEQLSDNGFYKNSWEILYKKSNLFDKAINIPNMGLFFLKISFTEEGHVYGHVQIVNTIRNAQLFCYQLEVGNKYTSIRFRGTVLACKTASNRMNEKCLFINNTFMEHILKKKDTFLCNLSITYLSESEDPTKVTS